MKYEPQCRSKYAIQGPFLKDIPCYLNKTPLDRLDINPPLKSQIENLITHIQGNNVNSVQQDTCVPSTFTVTATQFFNYLFNNKKQEGYKGVHLE